MREIQETGNFECEQDLIEKIQKIQARNCSLFCQTKIRTILNTINNSTVEDVADVIKAIEVKNVKAENTNLANGISEASSEYLDTSGISALEGISGALTSNQFDAGANDISLAFINDTKKLTLDKKSQLNGGGIVMHSKVYYDAVALGLVSNSTNTFGNSAQDSMVRNGELPETILGLTPIVTDKLALDSGDYRTFLVGPGVFVIRGNAAPNIEFQRKPNAKATITLFDISYGIGVDAMKWGLAGKEDVSDAELLDDSNWTLATNAHSNDVAIYRLQTT